MIPTLLIRPALQVRRDLHVRALEEAVGLAKALVLGWGPAAALLVEAVVAGCGLGGVEVRGGVEGDCGDGVSEMG